jgi:hypothetical protein
VLVADAIDLTRPVRLTFRNPSRRPLARLVARGLIQLVLVGLLPAEWQVRVALWPAFAVLAAQTLEDRLIGVVPAPSVEGAPAGGSGLSADATTGPLATGHGAGAPSGGGEEGEDGLTQQAQPRRSASKNRPEAVWTRRTGHGGRPRAGPASLGPRPARG